jgi:acyl-CoA hydrolase
MMAIDKRKYGIAPIVTPEAVFHKIRPGERIFISSGIAEPQTLVKYLMSIAAGKLDDIELVQIFSLSNSLSAQTISTKPFSLKTFCSRQSTEDTIVGGCVDLIPSRLTAVAELIRSGQVQIDVAFVQVTPPNEAGYCSLGVAVDVAREAMEAAALKVGEINPNIPYTFGDTYVAVDEFDMLVESHQQPLYFQRELVTDIHQKVAGHVASLIGNESCLAFSTDPLFEALVDILAHKRHL